MTINRTVRPTGARQIEFGGQMPCHGSRRVGDEVASLGNPRAYKGERGLTIIELLVAMAIFAILVGTAIPQAQPNRYALWEAQIQLMGDFRLTRTDALTKGDHFRLEITNANTYVERRLRFAGGVWAPDATPVRTRNLPPSVTFTAGIGRQYEFNTRGLLINPGAAETLRLNSSATGHNKDVTVWPSGQVSPG